MKYIMIVAAIGSIVGATISSIVHTTNVVKKMEEEGVQQQILKGVHPDNALEAYHREFKIEINYGSPQHQAALTEGLLYGLGAGAIAGAFIAFVVGKRGSHKEEEKIEP